MSNLTIRNLDDSIKSGLRLLANSHGRSMEEEALQILKQAVQSSVSKKGLGSRIHSRFAAIGGVEITLPQRTTSHKPPDFSDTENPLFCWNECRIMYEESSSEARVLA